MKEDKNLKGRRANCQRPRKLDDRAARGVKRISRKSPFMTSEEIAIEHESTGGTKVSSRTIRRCLKRLNLKSFVARRKPFVNSFQRLRRIRWAKDFLQKRNCFWRKTLFSDECPIPLFNGGRQQRVYRGPNEAFLPQHLRPTVKHSVSVMVWGCFSYKGVGKIRILAPKTTMNSTWYCSILQNEVASTLDDHFGGAYRANFQDDGAPCHRSKVVKRKCRQLGISQMPWPGQSPDLNPIENMWSFLKTKVRAHCPRTLDELKAAILQVWFNEIPLWYCQRLINSMPSRIKLVIKRKGFPTKY
jgi:hypothetical protein